MQQAINPLVFQRADPWVLLSESGDYYFTASVPEYDRVILRSARSVAGLSNATERVLWQRPAKGRMGGYIWAPEIHRIRGRWLIYFGAGDSDEVFHVRVYVLVCDSDDPMTGNWSVLGQVETEWDTFTLDATSFNHRGTDYLCWAQQEPGIKTNSNLYLAPLATPTTFAATPVRLSIPTLEWEIQGFKVNEGPAFHAHGDKVVLTYSASATDARYAMGMLWADAGSDLMDAASWTKSIEPVFKSAPDHCVFGPGHNSFTKDTCGRDLLVYHARSYKDIVGDPLYDPNRHTRVQHFTYDDRGLPDFGEPVRAGPLRD
ncbi:family 43 glycosylhydrolase [Tsuneonella mangrovi]|uniref:glycoside hydrolase family 43 protein n=1 Tax=Tsuneonella mangrovi TaxID=1982042 RepID=UPI001F0A2B5E|nr:family 43 glycosylhydrolase [Tsuneonella mangrovi]